MNIKRMIIKYNYSKRTDKIKYIVIHDTGNTGRGAGVNNHYNFFNGGNRGSSADYFVDDSLVGQFVDDYNYSWHCGDGYGKYGITNNNSIGIEICINSDGNYERAVSNAIELTKYLMNKYNIPASNVIRHYDASRKYCPNSMMANNWAKWKEFKARLTNTSNESLQPSDTSFLVRVTANGLNIRKGAGTNYGIVGCITDKGTYTIVETKGEWGKLKSGAGWIHLAYAERLSQPQKAITVGSKVKVIGSNYATGQTIPNWVKQSTYIVDEINNDKALLDKKGICSLVYLKDLVLV